MLNRGTKLGTYEITRHLGSGGMGEVYQAHDSKLDRDVAIKVLPEQFARDSERLARFQREAKLLAALNHPNIAAIYGLEQSGSTHYLVMELVPGQTLRERTAGERAVPVEEALTIAKQIAEALEAAHNNEKAIIHRDLKPANVKVTPEGRVKVLDFGLAKAFAAEPSPEDMPNSSTLSALPTMQGVIMGTAAYMSPEQARGKAVDKRTDIWAFGCVLYELLAGRGAFEGEDVTDTLSRVMQREPDFTALPAATPLPIRRLVRRCLEKDPKQRLRDIGDARLELERPEPNEADSLGHTARAEGKFSVPRWVAWAAAAVLALSIAVAATSWRRAIPVPRAGVSRFAVPVPSGFQMRNGQVPSLAISPDGSMIVFESGGRLYLRKLDRFESEPIPGTEGANLPSFSPDGMWLGFALGNRLMKVPTAGGPAVRIAGASTGNGGAVWGPDGRIVFAGGLGNGGLWSVSADGGRPEQITVVSESAQETQHMWPDVLPNGAVLYTVLGPSGHAQDARLVVQDPGTGRRAVVAEGVTNGRYVASGHLLYADANGTLLLQPFDLAGRRTTGPARAVLSGVRTSVWGGAVPYAVSSTGTLAYVTGTEFAESVLTELDLAGRERRRFGTPRSFGYPALSPDGRTLALTIRSPANDDIYLLDVESGRFDRFSFDAAEDESPIWSPDGKQIAYSSASVGEQRNVFVKTVGTTEPPRLVYTGKWHLHLTSWSPDGRWLAFYEFNPQSSDSWALNLDDPARLVPVATTQAVETGAVFSPDGRWLAYSSNETGRNEVYVVSFPDLAGKQQVSREGGFQPQWSATGQELLFVDRLQVLPTRMMMARRAGGEGALAWQNPIALFDAPSARPHTFTVARDGRSVYFLSMNPEGPAREILVVANWLQEVSGPAGSSARP